MRFEKHAIIFSSGKRRSTVYNIIGIGFGNAIYTADEEFHHPLEATNNPESPDNLSSDDLIELADFMIWRWTRLRTHYEKKKVHETGIASSLPRRSD